MSNSTSEFQSITWKIGGQAGFGIMTTGLMFSKMVLRSGFHVFDYVEYPSLIRGGHNVYEVRYSAGEVFSQERKIDLLIALNRETFTLHKNELKEGGAVVFDGDNQKIDSSEMPPNTILLPVPFLKIVKEAGANTLMQNNVALGASAAILGFSEEVLFSVITDIFKDKGEAIIEVNKKSAQLGYRYVSDNLQNKFTKKLTSNNPKKQLVVSGNEAVGLGAIAAGCKFFAAYPMTPTSNVLHFLAEKALETDMVVKHAEDEISVINMAIGASYAGVRSMVSTAGGGFSLMVEGLGLAGITETPLVIIEGQRPGPATGMPTWTGQGDLKFLIHASQDEFPRIILSPGDIEETFYLTYEAFNLADVYQTPVFILIDKYLAESHQSVPIFDTTKLILDRGKLITNLEAQGLSNYRRYLEVSDGISPRVIPGLKGTSFIVNSYEHEENGLSTEEREERIKQVNKRNQKLKTYLSKIPPPSIYGKENADITFIGWGSTKGPVLQALSEINFQFKEKSINFLHFNHVWPINQEIVSNILSKAKKKIMVEGNSEGQMALLIREQTGISMDDLLLKYDGRPFYPEEIFEKLRIL